MNELAAYSSNVTKLTTEIKVIQDNVCQGMIEIGKRLIEIKKELGHGQWLPYLENELGYKPTTASNLMRVATEFSNFQLTENIPRQKVFELLSLPVENREDFIKSTNVEDSTVRELKAEIQKYKEENGLLTERQQKALEDKRKKEEESQRLEQERQRLQQELQREKSKQPRIETKVVEKVVEKVIDKTDYKAMDRLKLLENANKELVFKTNNLEKSLSMNKQLLENYKTDSEEYRKLKLQMSKLQVEMDSVAQKQVSVLKLTELASEIEFFLYSKLAPTKYKDFMNVLNDDDTVRDNFIHTIEIVGDWYREMKTYVNENNYENIITVEVN